MIMRNKDGKFAPGSAGRLTHGLSRSKIYGVWRAMRSRCENPSVKQYHDYGGRGITVCERWHQFVNFHADMGDCPNGLTLDRIDNSKGYSPENCRWASRIDQSRNQRGLRMVSALGETKSLGEWSEVTGIKLATLWKRLNSGWTPDEAVSRPIRNNGARHNVRWSEPSTLTTEARRAA